MANREVLRPAQPRKESGHREGFIDPRKFLIELRRSIPFLQQIPDKSYFNLDISEFRLLSDEITKAREELEEGLGCHVMVYNRDVFNLEIPVEKHLCANIAGAQLTKKQLQLLQYYEEQNAEEKVSFVAYRKPLELTDPYQSELSKYYKEKGLIYPTEAPINTKT